MAAMWLRITNSDSLCGFVKFCAPLQFLPRRATFLSMQLASGSGMVDRSEGREDGEPSGNLIPLQEARLERLELPVTFSRRELDTILRLYGEMVAAGEWRDYAIDHLKDRAVFSVYRRASEVPLYQISKSPALARRQGAWSVVAATGMILKRGHDLAQVLRVFDGKLRLVRA